MERREYDRIVARLNKITEDAIQQISKSTSLSQCIQIFTKSRTEMLNDVIKMREKALSGVIKKDEYFLIVSRYASSQMYIFDAIKKQIFRLIDKEAAKLSQI